MSSVAPKDTTGPDYAQNNIDNSGTSNKNNSWIRDVEDPTSGDAPNYPGRPVEHSLVAPNDNRILNDKSGKQADNILPPRKAITQNDVFGMR